MRCLAHLRAHRVHHLDVQKHSAERVLELVYAPERPGLDPGLHDLEVRLKPVGGREIGDNGIERLPKWVAWRWADPYQDI